ncbi:hypothetical protein GW17_00047909 [Ensete ventricosum]|uniref:Uncharacterized protein n=1 Tax=Ensete ventricosum TaxID=4639 RepID=A0A444CVW0_ENSVE|nr:hypothetical protein GW17_00047909 [Ensete ventricosum]RZR71290.1 hypothetical protein BHM03_00004345 [Ensete ventricosum]
MLPLRFHNSGIRAKGWPAMARPPAGAATHGQAPTRVADCDQGPYRGASRRGRPWAWLAPTGVGSTCKGDDYGHNARRSCHPRGSGANRKGGRPWARQ